MSRRGPLTGLAAALALVAGLALGTSSTSGCCGCTRPNPLPTGAYLVSDDDGQEGLLNALVTVGDSSVEIDYMMPDGASWRAAYEIVGRDP